MFGGEKKTAMLPLASLVIIIVAYLLYARLTSVKIGDVFKNVSLQGIAASLSLLLLSELVKSYRLYVIVRGLGSKVTLKSCIVARLVGNTAGLLTPGNLGAEPMRVLTLASLNGIRIERLAAAGVLESLYDIIVTLVIAVGASLLYMPSSLPVFVTSLIIAALWIAGLTGLIYREGVWKRIVSKIAGKLPEKYRSQVFSRYEEFTYAVAQGILNKISLTSLLLTLLSMFLISISFIPLMGNNTEIELRAIISTILGYSMSFIMSFLPTPGGSGFFEYGLGVALEKELVLTWRMVFILFSIFPTLILLVIGVSIRKTVVKNIKKSILGESFN